MDVQIAHVASVTSTQAFESFVEAVLNSHRMRKVLRLKSHISPTFDVAEKSEVTEGETIVVIAVAIAVPVIFLALIVALICVRRRRSRFVPLNKIGNASDNHAISMDQLAQ